MLNNGHMIGRTLTKIHRLELKYLKPIFYPTGLPSSCFTFFLILFHHPGISQKQLCEMTQVDEAIATRLIKDMVKNDYVIKKVNPRDRRAFQLYLTEKGISFEPIIEEKLNIWWDTLLNELPVDILENGLNQMTKRAKQIINEKENKKI